jgi:hypothetical protein
MRNHPQECIKHTEGKSKIKKKYQKKLENKKNTRKMD